MKAELVPRNGDPPIPIHRDVTLVGRREYCDVQIEHPTLSKRHCVLVKTDGLLIIRDLATTNGTKVNGQRVRWAALLPNDRVTLGGYKVQVYLGPDDEPSPSERLRQVTSRPAFRAEPRPETTQTVPPTPAPPPPAPAIPLATRPAAPDDNSDLDELDWSRLEVSNPSADEEFIIELD